MSGLVYLASPYSHDDPKVRQERFETVCAVAAGFMANEGPGVAAGYLFELGAPIEVLWYCEGRPATRAEVLRSIDTGIPLLEEVARHEGQHALDALAAQRTLMEVLLPA